MRRKGPSTLLPPQLGGRTLAIACAALALLIGLVATGGPQTAAADHPECEVTDLGPVGGEIHRIEAEGRWTTENCDSAFLPNSDAHNYRFELTEDGHVRIDLTSPEGDSYVHLIAEDGSRVAHDDDGGPGLDSRIEAELTAGSYRVEASLGSGRARGAADFTLTIRHVTTCGAVDLGVLESGESLTQEGTWTVDDCRARYRDDTPAQTFRFEMTEAGFIRIDLSADEGGDPFLYLLSADGAYIQSDDDGGTYPASRIETDLAPGTYLIEATTYGGRDHVHILTTFALTLSFPGEETFQIKTEALHIPEVVIAGEPFTVHYRVGNLGHGDLPPGHYAVVVSVAHNGNRATAGPVFVNGGAWSAGTSYHSGAETATTTSTTHPALSPVRITISEAGPSWVVLAIIAYDSEENDVGFHRVERRVMVLSGPTYGPVTVSVDGTDYAVEASADEDGVVTTTVASVADANAEVDALTVARATYAAGVQALVLDGLFERPGLAGLAAAEEATEIAIPNASSSTLLRLFAEQYLEAIALFGLDDVLANGEVINPLDVQALVLHVADKAARQYAALSASWSALQEGVEGGAGLAFNDAFALQAGLAYAERLLAPIAAAGSIATQAGPGDMVPGDEYDALVRQASCGIASLGDAFAAAGVEDIDALLALDGELRANLPVFGLGSDAALCAIAGVDAANAAFLARLGIAESELVALNAPDPGPEPVVEEAPEPAPHRLRVIASLREDGRVEHGVEIDGTHILPPDRLLPADAPAGAWYASGDVEVDGAAIGVIRARRLADGRIELGFRDTYGEAIEPDVRFVADPQTGIFVRSSVIEVTPPAAVSEEEGASQ
ncbi:MAG: hypothetical protein OXE43_15905 [Chloroflexi bacterium]|nr:hypothetical protein [Chloroflexota bacterium]